MGAAGFPSFGSTLARPSGIDTILEVVPRSHDRSFPVGMRSARLRRGCASSGAEALRYPPNDLLTLVPEAFPKG